MLHPHHYSRAVKMAAAALLLLAMMGAKDPGCSERGGVKSDRPAADKQVDPRAQRVVTIEVTEATGPYDIWVRAAKVGQAQGDHTRDKRAGGSYKQTLDYTSGLRIEVTITVTGHRTDMFRCQISDGQHVVRERAAGQVQCKLTTQR